MMDIRNLEDSAQISIYLFYLHNKYYIMLLNLEIYASYQSLLGWMKGYSGVPLIVVSHCDMGAIEEL